MNRKAVPLAKITPPVLSGVIPRKRLFREIDTARNSPILWICGPPGSGKTTLVASYIKERKISSLWYRLDEGDGDAGSFFYYMGLAAKKAVPRRRSSPPLLTPESLPVLPIFAKRFFRYLYGHLKVPSVIIFDDYHEVPPGSPFHEVLRDGLDECPEEREGMNVIIISRNHPPAILSRLRARERVEIIGWNVLRLKLEESTEIARAQRQETPLSEDMINHLHKRSGGWIAGLVLLLKQEGSRGLATPSITGQTPSVVFDYLEGEVFDRLDVPTRDFLLKTAHLPEMTAKMAEDLTGRAEAGHILSYLERNHCFTEKSSHPEPVYQYHSLFREFLLERGKKEFTPDDLLNLKRHAAKIMESSGHVEDAVSLFFEIGDWDSSVHLICSQAPALIAQGRGQTLSSWLASLSQELIDKVPWLLYWKGVCNLLINPEDGRPFFEKAYQIFARDEDAAGVFLSWCGAVDSIFYTFRDFLRLAPWIDKLAEMRVRYPSFPSEEIETRLTYTMFRSLLFRNPAHPEFHGWAEKALQHFQRSRDILCRMEFIFHLVFYCHLVGDFPRALMMIQAMEESFRHISETSAPPIALLGWHATRAFYHWLTGSTDKCLEAVNDGLKVSRDTGVHRLDYVLLGQGIAGSLSVGDLAAARKLLSKMASSLDMGGYNDRAFYHFVAGWEALLKKEPPRALQHARASLKQAEELGGEWQKVLAQILMAQALLEQREDRKAKASLSHAHRFARESKSLFFEYICLLLKAQLALDRGDENACLNILRKAMAIGRGKGLLNFWGWRSDVMARLCAKALEAGIEVEYVQKLIVTRKLSPLPSSFYIDNWPWILRVYTLGRFELVKDGKPIQFTKKVPQKTLDLLKALITLGGRNVREEQLVDLLWKDVDGDAAHKSFEITLLRLRKLLGVHNAIHLRQSALTIDSWYCRVDTWVFERLIGEAEADIRKGGYTERSAEMVEKALGMYHGTFLSADAGKPWTAYLRDRLRSKFLRHVTGLGDYWEKRGKLEKAIECFKKGLEVDNRAEEFYQHLMICFARLGRRSEAVATYLRCKSILSSELGISPSSRTEALYKTVLTLP